MLFAQGVISLSGTIQDTSGNSLKAVSVKLYSDRDTLMTVSDAAGRYDFFNVKGKSIRLQYSIMGYQQENKAVFVADKTSKMEMVAIQMLPMPLLIKDVNIKKVVPVVFSGDTTQFNLDAFQFRKNSLLEEAFKNLPGFHVSRDGTVYYNGQAIRRGQVDGKDFFGGDLRVATSYLPTDFIKSIQVIDSYGNRDLQTGMRSGESEKIINVILREDKKQIYFGQFTVGVGSNDRYLGSLGINKFDDGNELSLLGSFNNTNTNLFSFGNPTGGDRYRNSLEIGDYADPVDGLNTVSSLGFNMRNQFKKSSSFNASYNYIQQRSLIEGFSQLTSTYINNIIRRKEESERKVVDHSHRLRFGVDSKLENNDVLKFDGNISFHKQNADNRREITLTNREMVNVGTYNDTTQHTSPNGEMDFMYSKHFEKKGRRLVGKFNLSSNNIRNEDYVYEQYDSTSFLQNQAVLQRNVTNNSKASVAYAEPFLENSLFEFSYEYEMTRIDADRRVENKIDPENPIFVDSLAVKYDYFFRNNKMSIAYQYEPSKFFVFNLGFAIQPLTMVGELRKEAVSYKYENINLIPSANILYRFSNDMDIQFDYKGKNNQPDFLQISPVVDNTSSRYIIRGNPELKAESGHRLASRIRKTITSRMQYLEASFAYNFVVNKIVSDKRSVADSTIQETTFRNTNGYYDSRWYYLFNTPFITEDLQLDLTGNVDYFNNVSFIDNRKRTTKQFLINQSVQLKYSWSAHFESVLNVNYFKNRAVYDIPFKRVINVETLFLGMGAKGYLNDDVAMGVEMSQRYNDGYINNFMNVNQTVMNAYVEYTFLPNRMALLRLQGFDLFDQNKNMGIYSEYIDNNVYEARNNRLGRYFMLSLNIRLQRLPKKG